ncbi:MAG: RsmD family RNA methyltransferase [Spirochaetes bacterium]|nr:RsmD family RNA methyltransferase [Spirochaetota bacterium]
MEGVKIIAGELKGRVIPFSNRKFGNADITTQKIKGALFSMAGEWLNARGFLDLYAGSGQVGIEALSRGADPTIINEPDMQRFRFIQSWLEGISLSRQPILLNLDDKRALEFARRRKITVSIIFLDPPYRREDNLSWRFGEIMGAIADSGILEEDGSVIIQHYHGNILDEEYGHYRLKRTRKFGKTSLSVYG